MVRNLLIVLFFALSIAHAEDPVVDCVPEQDLQGEARSAFSFLSIHPNRTYKPRKNLGRQSGFPGSLYQSFLTLIGQSLLRLLSSLTLPLKNR